MVASLVCVWLTLASAQEPAREKDTYFPKPSYFKTYFASPNTKVELEPPVKLEDYAIEGRLELSLKAFLSLVLANNTDISIQRLSVQTSRNAVTRSLGIFDPFATASFNTTRRLSAESSALSGAAKLNNLTQPLSMVVQQTLSSGASYNLNFSASKTSSNNSFATLNPSINTGLNFSVSQPLLRGRGSQITKLPIMIARSQLRTADYTFENQLMQLVASAELTYWALVEARENVRVAEEGLKLADATLKRSQLELQLGASSPLDSFQPQQSYANAQLTLSQTRYTVAQAENALRRQMGADLDPKYRAMAITLTEAVMTMVSPGTIDSEQMVTLALEHRPDLKASRQSLDIDDLSIRQTTNALRPNLSLTAQYGSSGTGGNFYERTDIFGGGQIVSVIPGGIGNALSQLFGFSLPTYSFGLSLQLPIKSHSAIANLADATVTKKLDALRIRTAEQNARLQVLNAVNNVENSKASLELAKIARDFAQQRLEAEQKKYELGTEVIFFVLQAQADLTSAESALVRESLNLRRNQLALLQQIGTLLLERGIAF